MKLCKIISGLLAVGSLLGLALLACSSGNENSTALVTASEHETIYGVEGRVTDYGTGDPLVDVHCKVYDETGGCYRGYEDYTDERGGYSILSYDFSPNCEGHYMHVDWHYFDGNTWAYGSCCTFQWYGPIEGHDFTIGG